MNSKIPIFPLNLVMYPDAIYPLHIFEERYKKMIKSCRNERTGFGIVSKFDSEISTVGCYVEIIEIYNTYDNGNIDILIKGIHRFQTISTSLNKNGYIEAFIIPYEDIDDRFNNIELRERTTSKFKKILQKTDIDLGQKYWNRFKKASRKSFKIAEKSGLNLRQQQNLLALQSESDRLSYLYEHFNKLERFIERSDIIKEIVSGDGYFNE